MRFKNLLLSVPLLLVSAFAYAQPTYSSAVKLIVESKCASCHGHSSPEYPAFKADKDGFTAKSIGPRMDTYAHLLYYTAWPDTGALMRRLDDGSSSKEGKQGNMYRYLGKDEEERKANFTLVKEWVGGWTLKRWTDITKEELSAIKVPY